MAWRFKTSFTYYPGTNESGKAFYVANLQNQSPAIARLAALYPEMDQGQLERANENLARYLRIAKEIFDELEQGPLTAESQNSTIQVQRSNSTLSNN